MFSIPNDDDLEVRETRFMPFGAVYEVDEDAISDLSKLDIMGDK